MLRAAQHSLKERGPDERDPPPAPPAQLLSTADSFERVNNRRPDRHTALRSVTPHGSLGTTPERTRPLRS